MEPHQVDLVEAVALLERGEPEAALVLLKRVVDQVPTNAVAQLNLGVAYEAAGQLAEAVTAYTEAAALNTADARPLELAARLYIGVEHWEGARGLLDQANRREEYSPRILTAMGVVEYRAGNLEMAEAFFDAALKADETYTSALYNAAVLQRDGRKDMERAVGGFEAYLEHVAEDDPRLAAVRDFVASHQSVPDLAPGPAPPAPEPEPAAPAAPPVESDPPAHVVKAVAELDKAIAGGAFDVALVTLKQALRQGAHPDLQWRLAELYRRHLAMPEKADVTYEAFATAYPADPRVADIPSDKPAAPAAPPVAEKPVDTTANRLWIRARNAHGEGDTARAMELYKAALEQDPTLFGAWYNLGLVAKSEGELETAQQAFETALKLRPAWSDARFMLAVVVHKQGDDERAAELLDQVLTTQLRHVKANYLLAVIYAKAGRRGMARTHFEHVLRLDGTGEFGLQARDWLEENRREPPPMPRR
jgi:tetratricopeptide (TPR) repeat protein